MITLVRPTKKDAATLSVLGNHFAIADTMISMPSPFLETDAMRWIKHAEQEVSHDAFLIKNAKTGELMGAANLRDIDTAHKVAEVSFWLSPPYWGSGHASVSLARLLEVGFVNHGLNRLYGYHMVRNPASGKVMEKAGFIQEGTLRQRVYKAGKYEDVQIWSILKQDWKALSAANSNEVAGA